MAPPQELGARREKVPPHLRLAKENIFEETSELREYSPSTSEVLLEEMCRSFGTELGQAYVNPVGGTKLVRASKPVMVTHDQTGERRLLQSQSTRFSPLWFSRQKVVKVYNQNAEPERKRSWEEVFQEIWSRIQERGGEKPNHFLEVTDRQHIPDVPLHRWPKALYFAVFEIDEKEKVSEEELEPFLIHAVWRFDGRFQGRVPRLSITFNIEPYFVVRGSREPIAKIYDYLSFSFPQISAEHRLNMETALSLHPLNKLDPEKLSSGRSTPEISFKETFSGFGAAYRLFSRIPRKITMAAIQKYLEVECLGERL